MHHQMIAVTCGSARLANMPLRITLLEHVLSLKVIIPTRWYLQGIQQLVSTRTHTYIFSFPEGGGTVDQLKSKVPQSGKVFIFGGGRGRGTLDQLKSKVPQSGQVSFGGGRAILDQVKIKGPQSGKVFIGGGVTLDQLKSKVPTSLTIFISGEGGLWGVGYALGTTFLKYLSGGTQGILN